MTNNNLRVIQAISLFVLVVILPPETAICGDANLDKILLDWKNRQRRTVSVSYELAGNRTTPKGIFSGDPVFEPNEVVPAADDVSPLSYKLTVHFDNDWLLVEKAFHCFYADTRKFVPAYWLVLYDGATMRHYEPKEKITGSGHIPSAAHPEVQVATVKPEELTMFGAFDLPIFAAHGFVPSESSFRLPARKNRYVLNGTRFRTHGAGIIDGNKCVIVKTSGDKRFEYWVDLSRQSSILRTRGYFKNRINFQLDTKQQKSNWGWVPASWTLSLFANNAVIRASESVEVKKTSVNLSLDKTQFQGKIKTGMLIKNYDKGKHFQLQSDGSLKEVNPKMLLAQSKYKSSMNAYVSIALVCAIFGIGCLLLLRIKRNRKSQVIHTKR